MRPHVGAKTLARYRQGDLSQRRSSRIGAHLARCARCRARSEDLAGVTALLASVHPPPMPEHLTARIQAALATEAATRVTPSAEKAPAGEKAAAAASAGTAGTGPAANGRRPRPEVPGHRRRTRPDRPFPAIALRALTAAAVVVLLGGGIYGLTRLGASSTSSSAGSAAGPAVPAPASQSAPRGITAIRSGTDYTPGNLGSQVAAQLARHGRSGAVAGPDATSPAHRPAEASGGRAAAGLSAAALAGCVHRIAAGERVLLVDVARYQGAPATVIVTQPAAGGPERIWVVGTGCSASRSDLLHHAMLNTVG
jgi:hypothetical protein